MISPLGLIVISPSEVFILCVSGIGVFGVTVPVVVAKATSDNPVAPAGPVAPVAPWIPCMPCGPCSPVAPVGPVAPVTP